MNDSPFSRTAARLLDQGYSILPVLPATKRPGTYSRGRWYGELDWARYCDRRPTEIEVELWSKWPDAGICVCMGAASGGLVAIDVDSDNSRIVSAIESVLAHLEPSPVRKAGRKGYTAFYRASTAVVSTAFNVVGERALDLLCHGKQTILPATLHPETGRAYEWQTEWTLEQVAPERLPMLPDDIAARLGAVLAPFGYSAPVERPHADSDGGMWREVNDIALQRLDDWVPHLGIDAKRNGNGNWRGKAIWKGAENANVGFSAEGIKDWGADLGMTAIDAVIASHGSDFPTAEKWLRQKLGFKEPPPVVFRSKPVVVAEPAVAVPAPAVYAPQAKIDPFDPDQAGGLLGATARWIYSVSIRPSRELSMLAALGFMSAFSGRRYVSPTWLTTNLYLCGIASTGIGKDGPLSAAKGLFEACGGAIRNMLGAGKFTSDAAMEKLMRQKPANLSTIDEIGAWLMESSGKRASPHAEARRGILLELYSLSKEGQFWQGKDRAMDERLSSSDPVYSPCLSILGMSTEELFFKGLTEENLGDGLVARLTIIHVGRAATRQRLTGSPKPPEALVGAYRDALCAWPKAGGLTNSMMGNALVPPNMALVDWESDEVRDMYEKFDDWQNDTIEENKQARHYMARASEQAMKIAMIKAISRDPANPKMSKEDWRFGQSFVCLSIDMMEVAIKRHMAGSDFESLHKKMRDYCREAGDKGIAPSALRRRPGMPKIPGRPWDEAVRFLTSQGMWRVGDTGKRGVRYFYVEDGSVEEEE